MTEELNDVFTRIILTICFGYDCSEDTLDLENENGQVKKVALPAALKKTFASLLGKAENFLRVLFDGLNRRCLTPAEFRVQSQEELSGHSIVHTGCYQEPKGG